MPLSSPYGSGCLSGLQPAFSVPSFVLCSVLVVSYVRAFRVVAIPQSGLLAQVRSLWLHVGHSCPILTNLQPAPPARPCPAPTSLWWMQASVLLFRWGSYCWACNLLVLIIYLFFPSCYVALCVSKACHRLGRESVSWCLETSLLKIPFPGRASLPRMELLPHLLCLLFRLLYFFPTCF